MQLCILKGLLVLLSAFTYLPTIQFVSIFVISNRLNTTYLLKQLFTTQLGTIQILCNHWTGWVGSEISLFCLLTLHIERVGGLENPPKHAYVIFEWSLTLN